MFVRRVLAYARPMVRNSFQIGAIYAAGDYTQQKFITRVKEYDYESTKNVAIVGGCVLAPIFTVWYNFLGRRLPGTVGKTLVKKLIADQVVAGGFGMCVFFIAMSCLERKENIFEEVIEKGPTAYVYSSLYWPLLMVGVFKKVAVPHQPVVVACFEFFWSIFICYFKMKNLHPDAVTAEVPTTKELERRAIDKVKVNAKET